MGFIQSEIFALDLKKPPGFNKTKRLHSVLLSSIMT